MVLTKSNFISKFEKEFLQKYILVFKKTHICFVLSKITLYCDVNVLRFFLWQSQDVFQVCKGGALPLFSWTRVCATQDGEEMKFYVNDELICTNSIEFEISEPENCDGPPCSVLVGDYYGARDYSFIGFIDEIYIFDYVPLDITNLPCNMHFFFRKRKHSKLCCVFFSFFFFQQK